jgi:hypothetical protein
MPAQALIDECAPHDGRQALLAERRLRADFDLYFAGFAALLDSAGGSEAHGPAALNERDPE